jgi:predicted MFS family arabinose efflux permease
MLSKERHQTATGPDVQEPHAGRMFDGLFRWHDVLRAFDRPLALAFAQFAMIAALIRPVFELLPGFVDGLATDGLDHAQAFSLLTSAQGFGAMIGALAVSWLLRKWSFAVVAMIFGMLAILSELIFLGSGGFFVALIAMALLSGAVLINGIATQVALQTQLVLQVRGRALSLYTMTFRGMPAVGALLVGATAEIFSLRAVSSSLAILAFCVMLWIIAVRAMK